MPVIVTVGLSRKLSKDFQSQGYSLNIQSELPATAIDDPNTMAQAADNLFHLANDLLDAQVTQATGTAEALMQVPVQKPTAAAGNNGRLDRPNAPRARNFYKGNAGPARNGGGNGNGGSPHRGITDAQKNAARRMAEKVGRDLDEIVRYEFGTSMAELTIRQGSELIDGLKGMIEAGKAQDAAK